MSPATQPEGRSPVGLPERSREFEFELGVPLATAVQVIRAALEDEGLTLAPEYSHGKITSVIVGGRKVVRVPAFRIVDPERDAEIRRLIQEGARQS